jgi:hypothetical protein
MTDKVEHAVRAASGVSSVLREVTRERDELRARLVESEAENDQWQKKLAEVWKELSELRQHDKEATDLTIDQQVEIGRLRSLLARHHQHLRSGHCDYCGDV